MKKEAEKQINDILVELTNKIGYNHSNEHLDAFNLAEAGLTELFKMLLKSEKAKERQEFIEILEGLEMKDIGFCHLPECQQQDTNDLPCDCGIAQRNDLYDIFREKQNQKIQEVIKIFKDEK